MEDKDENLKLLVCNTFLHVKDANEDARSMTRSKSDSSFCSSSHTPKKETRPLRSDRSLPNDGCGQMQSDDDKPVTVQPFGPDRVQWSVGAKDHGTGNCSPCAWNWKPNGCCKGAACKFCHMCTEDAMKNRRKKRVEHLKKERLQAASSNAYPGSQPSCEQTPTASSSFAGRAVEMPQSRVPMSAQDPGQAAAVENRGFVPGRATQERVVIGMQLGPSLLLPVPRGALPRNFAL